MKKIQKLLKKLTNSDSHKLVKKGHKKRQKSEKKVTKNDNLQNYNKMSQASVKK